MSFFDTKSRLGRVRLQDGRGDQGSVAHDARHRCAFDQQDRTFVRFAVGVVARDEQEVPVAIPIDVPRRRDLRNRRACLGRDERERR